MILNPGRGRHRIALSVSEQVNYALAMADLRYPAVFDHKDAHRFRIGLAPIALADWFEGAFDAADGDPAVRKAAVFAEHPELCWGEVEGSQAGQAEVAELMAAHFGVEVSREGPPLRWAAGLVDDDLCLMEHHNWAWTLTAASLCAPSFFSAAEVVGKPLSALHGPVPGFAATLLPRVSRIFDALAVDAIVERRNWSVVASGELFLPSSVPVRARQPLITDPGRELFVRMERQTLRRLPRTGGVLFTIRIWRHRLEDLRGDPGRLAAFAAAWDGVMGQAGEEFRDYKGLAALDPLVRGFLVG